jgi:hypothetical protein
MPRTLLASAALLSMLALGACSEKKTDANARAGDAANMPAASPTGVATSAENAPLYPDWAKAVAPPYPNATVGILVNTGFYQFQSTDDLATVYGWYKSHVNASWATDSTSGTRTATVNGVQIGISKNSVTTGDAAKVKTMIALNRG